MVIGQALLVAAALGAAGALAGSAVALRGGAAGRRTRLAERVGHDGAWAALGLTAVATLLLLALLVIGDLSVRYVWQHTASYEPVWRRITALLAGQEGSFHAWALAATAVSAWTAGRWRRNAATDRADAGIMHLVALAAALAVLSFTLASAPFQSFADAFPALDGSPIEGRGLNPVLANPWMPPHTLLTFVAYALVGLLLAVAVVELLRVAQGRPGAARRWHGHALVVTRWAWLAASAALVTGVVWAYEEMSFGWFWSWDPVEAATLSVWLLLTAALHARRAGDRALVAAPLLSALAFAAVVFASFVTRSGLHPSVHAFASGAVGRYLGALLAVTVVGMGILAALAWRRAPGRPRRRQPVWWAVWPLAAGAALITWGLGYPMGAAALERTVELDTGFFNLAGALLGVGLLLLLGYALQARGGRRRDARATLAAFAVLTAVAALVTPVPGLEIVGADRRAAVGGLHAWLGQASALVFLPPTAYALLGVAERWWRDAAEASRRARWAASGAALAHAGSVAALLGLALATLLSTTTSVDVDPASGSGSADGVAVTITDLAVAERTDAAGALVEERETATLEVRTAAGRVAAGQASLAIYPQRDMGRHPGVLIDRGPLADTQVVFHGTGEAGPEGMPVTVRRVPLINLVWGGLSLLLAGMALVLAARRGAVADGGRRQHARAEAELAATRGTP